jgi:hypothetical protein
VLHDTIDGEVIVIDLTTGTYYSLRGSAAEIWAMLRDAPGASNLEIAEALAVRYQPNGREIESAVTQFLGELHHEGLLTLVNATDTSVSLSVEPSTAPSVFASPVLDKFTDMQDLVLIDPVHDVSGVGWPHTADEAAAESSE